MKEAVDKAFLFYGNDCNYLFTLNSSKKTLILYQVTAKMQDLLSEDKNEIHHPKVACFSMSKK